MNANRFINGKLYGVCRWCCKIRRLDKPVFGALHLCRDPNTREPPIEVYNEMVSVLWDGKPPTAP